MKKEEVRLPPAPQKDRLRAVCFYLAGCRKQEKRGDAESIPIRGSSPRSLAERQQAVSFRYIKHEK